MLRVFSGGVAHSESLESPEPLVTLQRGLVGVEDGKVVFLSPEAEKQALKDRFMFDEDQVQHLNENQFLVPGFVDAHVHASQYPMLGKHLHLPLLEWLQKFTFPQESKLDDLELARSVYDKTVRRLLLNGSTTAQYFATNHLQSTIELCNVIERHGQRALVGKVSCDRNCPDFYREETSAALRDARRFVEYVLDRTWTNQLLLPVVTPRFAPGCSEQLLAGLGRLSSDLRVRVQSHISESTDECRMTEAQFSCRNYAECYERFGLLTSRTTMAHGIHLSDDEIQLLSDRRVSIVHCPNSNLSIRSGLMDFRKLEKGKIELSLGTDIAAGYSYSMLDCMRQTVQVSNALFTLKGDSADRPVNISEAFRSATLGGATALGLDSEIGNFMPGKQFDALLINVQPQNSPFDVFNESLEETLTKFLYLGDDRNIEKIFVAGHQIKL